jgi:hypothetical protein
MERELCIFEMSDAGNPVSLARSRLLQERLLKEYVATRARHAISLKSVPRSDDDLWSFVMLRDDQLVSVVFLFPSVPCVVLLLILTASTQVGYRERSTVGPADSSGPGRRPRRVAAGAGAGGVREGEEDQAALALGIV